LQSSWHAGQRTQKGWLDWSSTKFVGWEPAKGRGKGNFKIIDGWGKGAACQLVLVTK